MEGEVSAYEKVARQVDLYGKVLRAHDGLLAATRSDNILIGELLQSVIDELTSPTPVPDPPSDPPADFRMKVSERFARRVEILQAQVDEANKKAAEERDRKSGLVAVHGDQVVPA